MNDFLNKLKSDSIDKLQVCYNDYNGRLCGKIVPESKFNAVIEKGVVFAKANLSFGLDDHFAEGAKFLADSGDFLAMPDLSSYTILPRRKRTARVNSFMLDDNQSKWKGCPRTRLSEIVKKFSNKGIKIKLGLEPEFSLFKKDNNEYVPISYDGMFTISGIDRLHDFWGNFLDACKKMNIKCEQFGKEYGPGQYEATWQCDNPIKTIDNYINYKDFIVALAREYDLSATFMPKPFAHLSGNGLHLHISLWDESEKKEISCTADDKVPLSKLGNNFIAGLLSHAQALTCLGCATVNSYKRILPGSWAPAHICWGIGNRSVLIRIPSKVNRKHIELRHGDNAINPFIYLTGVFTAGLHGIENKLEAPDPVESDVGQLSKEESISRNIGVLPRTLSESLSFLKKDQIIQEALGEIICNEFIKIKETELKHFETDVHAWERSRYFNNF